MGIQKAGKTSHEFGGIEWIFLVLTIIAALCTPISAQEDSAGYWFEMGKGLLRNESYEEAVQVFDKAIEMDPDLPVVHYKKSLALKAMGRSAEADSALAKAAASIPVPIIYASNPAPKWSLGISAANYDGGAAFTESYGNAEYLKVDTDLRMRSDPSGSVLEASTNSNVVGQAHIGWESVDPAPGACGRHPVYGRSVEDMIGVFSIEKSIQLWGNNTSAQTCVDWLSSI